MTNGDSNLSLRRHAPFYIAVVVALLSLLLCLVIEPKLMIVGTPVVFFVVYLVLTGFQLRKLTASYLKKHAAGTDEPAPIIFAVTLATIIASVASLFMVLNKAPGTPPLASLVLAFLAVTLGWLTIHTMAALHYAHRYWSPAIGTTADKENGGGLNFPGDTEPGIYDFLYFSFVIGMTGQTSDIAITSTDMRKLSLLHSIVSFFFNTTLVAAAVNTAVSLA
ncbi:putative membrane protein [Pararhizobium capsulatum DSM 1112]|uniref:Membrane protein n=1 Tax=Pararhizobium capsulatum DSM 1112 TaxID=1121113 RepID=A0ABU0BPU1_9HYPH|nr:DUF1345 domain-containing protein [Pararhizobium capsulatum]MDQ0319982.1 putative membrane protein [Pararhizobium capsulatum DSM 1112]